MKNIKEMIIPILLGFTLVVSVYSSVKVIQNEKEIKKIIHVNNEVNDYYKEKLKTLQDNVFDFSIHNHRTIFDNEMRIDDNESHISDIDNFLDDLEKEIKYTYDFEVFLRELKKELKNR